MNLLNKFAYAVTFQIGWVVCVTGDNMLSFLYALIFTGTYLGVTFRNYHSIKLEIIWIALVLTLGLCLETISFSLGLLQSANPASLGYFKLPPVWLISLWGLFAVALLTCLSFVFRNPVVAYLISSIAIPLNYFSGAALNGDITVNRPYALSLGLISILWICLLWILVSLKRCYFEEIFRAR